jgi:signal transduction histidine kinase
LRTLYLRIYLTLIGVLLAFALAAGWLAQRHLSQERAVADAAQEERLQALATLLASSLPPSSASPSAQADALLRWSQQLRMPLALVGADGTRIASNSRFERREERGDEALWVPLGDGRKLLFMRPFRAPKGGADLLPPLWPGGPGRGPVHVLIALFVVLFIGVALGAWPVVRRLTKRLETLKQGVERFGAGHLQQRVALEGRDEVAQLAQSFNATADRIESVLKANQSLLANASHELRSPLARLKMALALRDEGREAHSLDGEIARNVRELDALVEEVLLASRLEANAQQLTLLPVDLLALCAELAALHGIELLQRAAGTPTVVKADDRLLRRVLRNLIENAQRYGGQGLALELVAAQCHGQPALALRMLDRGPGVPDDLRERIFEPFFRLPGHAEMAGGVGLGLSLIRQIAKAYGGAAFCESRDGGGSAFVVLLPL